MTGDITVDVDLDDVNGTADVDFHFRVYTDDTFACDDTYGYAAIADSFDMHWESTDSVAFDLWGGSFYFKGTKYLDTYGQIYEQSTGYLTGIEYEMVGTFVYPIPTSAEIAKINATGYGDRIEIDWSTTSEVNNAGFYVLRGESEKGPFKTITDQLIPAKGSELAGADYSFTDRDVSGGTYFYRLEVVDVDGKVGWTDPVRAENKPAAFSLAQNYPNPFNPVT
jgi:hypothetical protein